MLSVEFAIQTIIRTDWWILIGSNCIIDWVFHPQVDVVEWQQTGKLMMLLTEYKNVGQFNLYTTRVIALCEFILLLPYLTEEELNLADGIMCRYYHYMKKPERKIFHDRLIDRAVIFVHDNRHFDYISLATAKNIVSLVTKYPHNDRIRHVARRCWKSMHDHHLVPACEYVDQLTQLLKHRHWWQCWTS